MGTAPIYWASGMCTYTIPSGNAEKVATMLTQSFKKSDLVKITSLDNTRLLVRALPQDHLTIARDLESSRPSSRMVKLALNNADASRVVETLAKIYASGDGKSGYPYFEADSVDNALIVKGSAEQISEVRGFVNVLTDQGVRDNSFANDARVRVIALDHGHTVALAEALQKAMERLGPNPVQLYVPGAQLPAQKKQR